MAILRAVLHLLPTRSDIALCVSSPFAKGWVRRCRIISPRFTPKACVIRHAHMARVNTYLAKDEVEAAFLFQMRHNMILAPIEHESPTPRWIPGRSRNMCIHKFQQAWVFSLQFQSNVAWQLDLWRLKEWVQPIGECLEVDEFLNGLRHFGTAGITMDFPVQA